MSHVLAVFDSGSERFHDAFILDAILDHRPDRVTVLVTGTAAGAALSDDGPAADAVRDRLAWLLTAIERRTGATVAGIVGEPAGLDHGVDAVVGDARVPAAA
ncbi:MAG TPA: hypothetical protein VFN55_15970 [Solirubrobacteraceae bacterium]|nr:hypothetical protein [Solirubrobacteraceae bacterium]